MAKEISIHAPREGGDLICFPQTANGLYFNPRPPRGGRRDFVAALLTSLGISIHAPREGGDAIVCMMVPVISIFQSTPPARGAT